MEKIIEVGAHRKMVGGTRKVVSCTAVANVVLVNFHTYPPAEPNHGGAFFNL